MEILEDEVREFIRNYVNALKKLVEEKRQQIESIGIEAGFPTEFPVKATAYLGERGIIIDFERADSLGISVKRGERPHARGKWGEFIHYPRFERIKDKASEKAESDVKYLLNLPKMIEEHEQQEQSYYESLWIKEMQYTAEDYVKFLNEAKEVVEKTKEKSIQELYDIVTVIQSHLSNFEYMLRAGCKTLDQLYFMINSDLETSLFLALHGKYYSAMAILRKILEVNIRCLYLDSSQNKIITQRQIDDWINGGKFPINKTFEEIVNDMIDDRIDQSLTKLLKQLRVFEDDSFRHLIIFLYKELCVYVHLRPRVQLYDDLTLSFSEFNLDKWQIYCAKLRKVLKLTEILLILKFPKIASMRGLADPAETYQRLQLSERELDEIASFSISNS
jgi:hypothetical protein